VRVVLDKMLYKKKWITKCILLCFCAMCVLWGCGTSSEEIQTQMSEESVIQNDTIENNEIKNNKIKNNKIKNNKIETINQTKEVAYDLTTMGSEMVYAMVYQFMMNPQDYIGETIKMQGTYYSVWYEQTQKYYHYCIIQDALACCAQGMEFVWEDGSHSYPEEYPENETEVLITGEFETYQEEGDTSLYCRLKNASMEIVSDS